MKQFLVLAPMPPYTVPVQFVVEAPDWNAVLAKNPKAKLIKEL